MTDQNDTLERVAMDLVKRLRDWQTVHPCDADKPEGHLYEEAAARIEQLEARVAALGEDATGLGKSCTAMLDATAIGNEALREMIVRLPQPDPAGKAHSHISYINGYIKAQHDILALTKQRVPDAIREDG